MGGTRDQKPDVRQTPMGPGSVTEAEGQQEGGKDGQCMKPCWGGGEVGGLAAPGSGMGVGKAGPFTAQL